MRLPALALCLTLTGCAVLPNPSLQAQADQSNRQAALYQQQGLGPLARVEDERADRLRLQSKKQEYTFLDWLVDAVFQNLPDPTERKKR